MTPEQARLIQQELLRRNDFTSNALLLLRHTGMRIGECIDLSVDCLRAVGPDQWAIHVPLGKLKTERLVPVDSLVRQLVDRLRSMRSPERRMTLRRAATGRKAATPSSTPFCTIQSILSLLHMACANMMCRPEAGCAMQVCRLPSMTRLPEI